MRIRIPALLGDYSNHLKYYVLPGKRAASRQAGHGPGGSHVIVALQARGLVAPSGVLEKREHDEPHHRRHGDRLEVHGEVVASPRERGGQRLGPVDTCPCVCVCVCAWVCVRACVVGNNVESMRCRPW